jgi:hypothetical protein
MLTNVVVLTAPDAKSGQSVLLKVSDVDAAKLLYAEQFQKIWLVERPQTQAQDSPPALESESTILFDGLSPVQGQKAVAGLKSFLKALGPANGGA